MKTKKIARGIYKVGEYYISAYYGELQTVWNIFSDEHLLNEFAIGFNSKKECIQYLKTK